MAAERMAKPFAAHFESAMPKFRLISKFASACYEFSCLHDGSESRAALLEQALAYPARLYRFPISRYQTRSVIARVAER